MASILLVAHEPLASALLAVARHAYADCSREVAAVDVPSTDGIDQAAGRIQAAMATLPEGEVLVLTDAFGATPCNAAVGVSDGVHARVVCGVNVPMLWRTLCYSHLSLSELVARAADGGRQGIMQVASPRRQNQPNRPPTDDPDSNPDQ